MTLTQQIITIGVVVLGTLLTRFLPFCLFPAGKPTPKYVQYLGKVLPASVFALLVVYCVKDVSWNVPPYGIPEGVGIAVTNANHQVELIPIGFVSHFKRVVRIIPITEMYRPA